MFEENFKMKITSVYFSLMILSAVNSGPLQTFNMPNELKILTSLEFCYQLVYVTITPKITAVYNSIITLTDSFGRLMKSESSCLTINPFYEDGYTILMTESYIGNMDRVKSLLARNVDVNKMSRHRETALMLASQQGHHEVVRLLLEHDADLKITLPNGLTPLMLASFSGHAKTVEMLLKYGADINTKVGNGLNAFLLAVLRNHFHVVELFLTQKLGTIKNETLSRALLLATDKGYTNVVDTILRYRKIDDGLLFAFCEHKHPILDVFFKYVDINTKDERGWTLLHHAANKGDNLNVEYLLKMRANINSKCRPYGQSALALATNNGHFKTVDLLLKNGANVDGINDYGQSHLIKAAELGKYEIVQLLLKNGADINKFDNAGSIALQYAVIYGHYNCVELLLKNHARVNHQSNNGASALIMAATKRHHNIVKLLLAYGADVNQFDENNNNALKIASQLGDIETINLLLNHGPIVNTDNKLTEDAPSYTEKQGSHDDGERNLLALNTNDESFSTLKDTVYALTSIPISIVVASLLILFLARKICLHIKKQITQIKPMLTLQNKMFSFYWDFFFDITNTPLKLHNVWGCDKTCQPNESGFFRLLNFRGKLHSSIHIQEVSPNCNGCLVTSTNDNQSCENSCIIEHYLILKYIQFVKQTINDKCILANIKTNEDELNFYRKIYQAANEICVALHFGLQLNGLRDRSLYCKRLEKIKSNLKLLPEKESMAKAKLQRIFRKKKNQIRITEPQLICTMLDLNELFENYLLELDMESINHQTLVYFLNRWLENTVQAIEETDRSISLYDCMLRIGLSEEKATSYIGYLCEEFINMYSSLYWLSRYFENLCLMNPLITELPRTCLFEGDFNVWKSGQVQRVSNNESFELKFLNQKSPKRLDNHDIDSTCERVSRYLKKQKDKDSLFLFHGTSLISAINILERGINLVKGKQNLDFSHAKGFYVINNLRKSVEWSCTHKPELHAVVIFKLKKTEMDNGNGLVLEDEREWGEVVTACRKGFENDNGPDVEDRLQNVDFVRGFICANGREVHRNNHNPVIMGERDGYRPLQTCILNKDYARWFGSPTNIFGLVIFRNG